MATSDAPISIGRVSLVVNDLKRMAEFYAKTLGLSVLSQDGETAQLGAGRRVLLELRSDPLARWRPHEAGLFHTAFLLPSRGHLASWLDHAVSLGVRLDGASDHSVSEAIYLQDPEGNGIEVYADRPRSEWETAREHVRTSTRALNLQALSKSSIGRWTAAPEDTVVGHVHLQVGDVALADDFMLGTLKLDKTNAMPSAGFYSSGGYHHHFAGNIWQSANAGTRSPNTTGLAEVEVLADPTILSPGLVTDPWGTPFRVVAA